MSKQYISFSIAVLLSMVTVGSSVAAQTGSETRSQLVSPIVTAINSKADLATNSNTKEYDYNGDNLNSVGDVSQQLSLVVNPDDAQTNEGQDYPVADAPRRNAAAATSETDYLLKGTLTGTNLKISLEKNYTFVAFQFDINVKSGENATAALVTTLSGAPYNFLVASNNIGSGSENIVRVIAYNLANTQFEGKATVDLANVTFGSAPAGDLSFSNVIFVAPVESQGDTYKDDTQTGEIESGSLTGDVNLDGSVNIQDVIATIAVMQGDTTYADTSDVNGDGSTNIQDVIAIIDIMKQ